MRNAIAILAVTAVVSPAKTALADGAGLFALPPNACKVALLQPSISREDHLRSVAKKLAPTVELLTSLPVTPAMMGYWGVGISVQGTL